PLAVEETDETPQRLADVNRYVLPFVGTKPPQSGNSYRLRGQGDRSHAAESQSARDDRIAAVKRELPAAVGGRHPDFFQHVVDTAVQIEIRGGFRIRELGAQRLSQEIGVHRAASGTCSVLSLMRPSSTSSRSASSSSMEREPTS